MPVKIFSTDEDPRLGHLNPDGTVARWPDQDAAGQLYAAALSTIDMPGGRHFVVLPGGMNSVTFINEVKDAYKVAAPAAPRRERKPADDDQ